MWYQIIRCLSSILPSFIAVFYLIYYPVISYKYQCRGFTQMSKFIDIHWSYRLINSILATLHIIPVLTVTSFGISNTTKDFQGRGHCSVSHLSHPFITCTIVMYVILVQWNRKTLIHSGDWITSIDSRETNREIFFNAGTICKQLRDTMLSDLSSSLKQFTESDIFKWLIPCRKFLCQNLVAFFTSL